jgi:hypothetical protein
VAPSVVRHSRDEDFVSGGGFQERRVKVALEEGPGFDRICGDALDQSLAREDRLTPSRGELAHRDLIARGAVAGQP